MHPNKTSKIDTMRENGSPVVAFLSRRSPHPYSSITLSPDRKHAIVAGKDMLHVLKVEVVGLTEILTLRISQHFQTSVSAVTAARPQSGKVYGDVRETFKITAKQAPQVNLSNNNIVICDIAWSMPQHDGMDRDDSQRGGSGEMLTDELDDSLVAVAGSNGVVVVWNARQAFLESSSPMFANQQPEGILNQHTRAVNRLDWHPRRPGLLLTGSQDSSVKLWARQAVSARPTPVVANNQGLRSWLGIAATEPQLSQSYTWKCLTTFQPKGDAVRDVRWSPFQDDVFALVTASGSLIVYNMNIPASSLVKIAAHGDDASTLDWHPTRPYVLATGAADRCVKVWDLESSISMSLIKPDDRNLCINSSTVGTESSNEEAGNTVGSQATTHQLTSRLSMGSTHGLNASRHKAVAGTKIHMLYVSSPVTRLKWRPPAFDRLPENLASDPHESMLVVATAPVKGASAGGSGALSLWSYYRPFMPLSVVEGHVEGSVTDFAWLETPQVDFTTRNRSSFDSRRQRHDSNDKSKDISEYHDSLSSRSRRRKSHQDVEHYIDVFQDDKPVIAWATHIWQHVISVGRDGQCLVQSLVRGERPLSRVPPSCFSLANLSPFQQGYGSLQIFSVSQRLPTGKDELLLTGLRQDETTARAPGVFKEPMADQSAEAAEESNGLHWIPGHRLPVESPELIFNVVDQGDLDSEGRPIEPDHSAVTVGPEVVHLSRFANRYRFYRDDALPTKVDLCLHNGDVAEELTCGALARMWRSIAKILSGSGLDELPQGEPRNAMQFVVLPTVKNLLEERADAGDVQTCVAICEVLQVIKCDTQESQVTRIPGLDLNLVREWYLSYIDLLQQMCLFSHASFLIRSCNDPFIGALNQKSTTIHESCSSCGKPLLPSQSSDGRHANQGMARRACKSCRKRVGLCFLCHEPVKGMFVWCPGCGHGGHLDHALQWFGGLTGKPVRQVCPTGCGHRCNLMQQLSAFPRTELVHCLPVSD